MKISQTQINRMVDKLADMIPTQYAYIVGIANSGLHVSCSLAIKLKLPHRSIRISHYDGRTPRDKPIVYGYLPPNSLVVDDLIDTGRTMQTLIKHYGQQDTAVLFWDSKSYKPTYFVDYKPDEWVVFPWNKE